VDVQDDRVGSTWTGGDFVEAGKVGLISMRERAQLAGGTFSIRSTPNGGTSVLATIPFEALATGAGQAADLPGA
jgi:signal transduction histidine kinase